MNYHKTRKRAALFIRSKNNNNIYIHEGKDNNGATGHVGQIFDLPAAKRLIAESDFGYDLEYVNANDVLPSKKAKP